MTTKEPRASINPLAEQYEQRHGAMLDHIHRLIGILGEYSCVCMPSGMVISGKKRRRATDLECAFATMDIDASLRFRVDGDGVADEAATALEQFAKEVIETAKIIRKNVAISRQKPGRRKGKAA